MSRTRYKFYPSSFGPYFCTSTFINWLPLSGNSKIMQILLDSLGFLIEHNRIKLHGFVIMPDHVHIVGSGENMGKEFGHFRSFTARQIVDYLKEHQYFSTLAILKRFKKSYNRRQDYQVWEEGVQPKLVTSQDMLRQKINYIHNNPVEGGFVKNPEYWIYSSASFYAGGDCLLPITVIY